jgi:hypothetical protein
VNLFDRYQNLISLSTLALAPFDPVDADNRVSPGIRTTTTAEVVHFRSLLDSKSSLLNPIATLVEHDWRGYKNVPRFEHGIRSTNFSFGTVCSLKHPSIQVQGI